MGERQDVSSEDLLATRLRLGRGGSVTWVGVAFAGWSALVVGVAGSVTLSLSIYSDVAFANSIDGRV